MHVRSVCNEIHQNLFNLPSAAGDAPAAQLNEILCHQSVKLERVHRDDASSALSVDFVLDLTAAET